MNIEELCEYQLLYRKHPVKYGEDPLKAALTVQYIRFCNYSPDEVASPLSFYVTTSREKSGQLWLYNVPECPRKTVTTTHIYRHMSQ